MECGAPMERQFTFINFKLSTFLKLININWRSTGAPLELHSSPKDTALGRRSKRWVGFSTHLGARSNSSGMARCLRYSSLSGVYTLTALLRPKSRVQ